MHAPWWQAGADIIDVGGESTRPGAGRGGRAGGNRPRDAGDRSHCAALDVPGSVDTSKPEVMQAAAAAGAGMINDVYALRRPGALATAAGLGLPVCLMHMQGEPRSHAAAARIMTDVVAEVEAFLLQRAQAAEAAGIARAGIWLDPGFGFGKTLQHNLALLRALPRLAAHGLSAAGGPVTQIHAAGHNRARGGATPGRFTGLGAAGRPGRCGHLRVHDVAGDRRCTEVSWRQLWPDRAARRSRISAMSRTVFWHRRHSWPGGRAPDHGGFHAAPGPGRRRGAGRQ